MKRLFLLILAACSLLASAEVITMDLTTATDLLANPVTYSTSYGDGYYDCTDVWDSTYNDSGFVSSSIPTMHALCSRICQV